MIEKRKCQVCGQSMEFHCLNCYDTKLDVIINPILVSLLRFCDSRKELGLVSNYAKEQLELAHGENRPVHSTEGLMVTYRAMRRGLLRYDGTIWQRGFGSSAILITDKGTELIKGI